MCIRDRVLCDGFFLLPTVCFSALHTFSHFFFLVFGHIFCACALWYRFPSCLVVSPFRHRVSMLHSFHQLLSPVSAHSHNVHFLCHILPTKSLYVKSVCDIWIPFQNVLCQSLCASERSKALNVHFLCQILPTISVQNLCVTFEYPFKMHSVGVWTQQGSWPQAPAPCGTAGV